jgi:hypothetical protein
METKLIYIGDFYNRSKTMMSPIYTEDGRRYDWGFLERDLRDGKSVSIRQANAIEREHYERKLQELNRAIG